MEFNNNGGEDPKQPTPPSKVLWEKMFAAGDYEKSYDEFVKQYSNESSVNELYGALSAKQAYNKPREEFIKQYFPAPAPPPKKPTTFHDKMKSYLVAGKKVIDQSTVIDKDAIKQYEQSSATAVTFDKKIEQARRGNNGWLYSGLGLDKLEEAINPDVAVDRESEQSKILGQKGFFTAQADAALEKMRPEIDKVISTIDYNNFITKSSEGFDVPDEVKISEWAKNMARTAGVADDGYFKWLIQNEASAGVAHKIIEPKVEGEFAKLYKEKTGMEISDVSGEKQGLALIEETKTQLAKLQQDVELSRSAKFKELEKGLLSQIGSINDELSQAEAQLKQFEPLIKDGKFSGTEEEFAMYKAAYENLNTLAENSKQKVNELISASLSEQNAINSQYKTRFERQQAEIIKLNESRYKQLSDQLKINTDPQLLKSLYSQAYQNVLSRDEQVKKTLSRFQGPGVTLVKSFAKSFGTSVKNISTSLGWDYGRTMGKMIENNYQPGNTNIQSISDLIDANQLAASTGQLFGSMLPGIVASGGVVLATRGAGAGTAAQIIAGALASFSAETVQMTGSVWDEKFKETGDVMAADNAANEMLKGQIAMSWAYSLDALPFMGRVIKMGKYLPVRMAAGGAVELAAETVQEYGQGLIEEAALSDKSFADALEYHNWDKFKNTALNVAPVAMFGMAGQLNGYTKEAFQKEAAKRADKAYEQKVKYGNLTSKQQEQVVFDMVQRVGLQKAAASIQAAFTNGEFDQATYDKLSTIMEDADNIINKSTELSLSPAEQKVFAALKFKLDDAVASFEAESDPVIKAALGEVVSVLKKSVESYPQTKQANVSVITYADNTQVIATNHEAKNALANEDFKDDVANGEVRVTELGNDGEVSKMVKETGAPAPQPQEIEMMAKEMMGLLGGVEVSDVKSATTPNVNVPSEQVVDTESTAPTESDIALGKVGNTEYEVKADGVDFGGKKLDNPKNLSHKELITEHIRRRKQEELDKVWSNYSEKESMDSTYLPKVKALIMKAYGTEYLMQDSVPIVDEDTLQKINEEINSLHREASNKLIKKINAKYEAEVNALEAAQISQQKTNQNETDDNTIAETTHSEKTNGQQTQTTEAQLQEFGVPEQDVKPVTNVLTAMVDGLRKAGLTAAKTVGEFVGIGRTKQQDIETKDAIAEITQTIEVPKLQPVKVKEEVIETKTEQVSPTVNKITDVGEKIGGARKDLAEKLGSVTSEDIKSQPLSKVFPKPDFDKLISEKGISKDVAILLNYLYSKIPSKPRKSYQVSRWVDKVNEVIGIYRNILEEEGGSRFAERVIDGLRKSSTFQRDYNIYSAIINQLGFGFNPGTLEIKEFSRADDGKKTFSIVNGRFIVKDYDTLEEAVNGLGQIVDAKKDKPKETKFDIYQDTKTKEYFVGKKGATGVNRIAEGFKTLKEASEFLKTNQNQLQETWNALRGIPTERRKENRDRKGIDWRKGNNVDAEEFRNTFGFRGVEFGNWVNQNERQQSINEAYDALMDLASVLKLSPKAISLGGELGFAFGARGSGKHNAHYEPDKIVINLTKTKGAGSVAHEWWHGIDNYFSRKRGVKTGYVTESPRQRITREGTPDESVRKEMIDAFKGVVDVIRNSKLPERSKDLDKGRSNVYWSTPIEMTARAFENFVIEKLAQTGYVNDYLANLKSVDEWIKDSKGAIDATKNYPYPLADETHSINEAYQNFFDTIQEREEGGRSILFQDANAKYRVESGKRLIEALKDFSKAENKRQATVAIMHEIMHPTVETIITGAKEGNVVGQKHTKTIVEEYNKANPNNKVTEQELIADNDKFVNGETTDKYRAVQEFIAEQWERYHQEGAKGFSKSFQEVLDAISEAFRSVYKSLTGKELTPELRQMFDEILGKQQQNINENEQPAEATTPPQPKIKVRKKRAKPSKLKNPTMIRAMKLEDMTPEIMAAQYIIGGGKVHPDAIRSLMGRKGKAKAIGGEMKARLSILSNNGPGLDELAHQLWESYRSNLADWDIEIYESSDFRDAVESALLNFNGREMMAQELLDTYDYEMALQNQVSPEDEYYQGADEYTIPYEIAQEMAAETAAMQEAAWADPEFVKLMVEHAELSQMLADEHFNSELSEQEYEQLADDVKKYANGESISELEKDEQSGVEEAPSGSPAEQAGESAEGYNDVPAQPQTEVDKKLSDKIRSLKIKLGDGGLQSNIAGLPIAIFNAAVETVALAIDAGMTIAQAINKAINDHGLRGNPSFDQTQFEQKLSGLMTPAAPPPMPTPSNDVVKNTAREIKRLQAEGKSTQEVIDAALDYMELNWPAAALGAMDRNYWGNVISAGIDAKADAANLTPQTGKALEVSKAKYKSAINNQKKNPSFFSRVGRFFKNLSQYTDNPNRFITKLRKDIEKTYGMPKGNIPLGRIFEQNANGLALSRVHDFLNRVVNGLSRKDIPLFQEYIFFKRIQDRNMRNVSNQAFGVQENNADTGNITLQDAVNVLSDMKQRIGADKFSEFEARGEQMQQVMDDMLRHLVENGVLSKEAYDEIKAENDFYAPFNVVQKYNRYSGSDTPAVKASTVQKIRGIAFKDGKYTDDAVVKLRQMLEDGKITKDEFYELAIDELEWRESTGVITNKQFTEELSKLGDAGFVITDILDKTANIIFDSYRLAHRNGLVARVAEALPYDTGGQFVIPVDGFDVRYNKDGSAYMVPKRLSDVKVPEGFGVISYRELGKTKFLGIELNAANAINKLDRTTLPWWARGANGFNAVFRLAVITLSMPFQATNMGIDIVRTAAMGRYGLLAGRGVADGIANALLFIPQYIESILVAGAANIAGYRTDMYKKFMESPGFTAGLFDDPFTKKERTLNVMPKSFFQKVKYGGLDKVFNLIDGIGRTLEQSHKITTYQRGMDIDAGVRMGISRWKNLISEAKTPSDMQDAIDKIAYETQNYAGSPNFPAVHSAMKLMSVFFQFFSARLKGEMTDLRRVAAIFGSNIEGVNYSKRQRAALAIQFAATISPIIYYALKNNDEENEEDWATVSPFDKDNKMLVDIGTFEYEDENGNTKTYKEYAKIPLRGITANINIMAHNFIKYAKDSDPEVLQSAILSVIGNISPITVHGDSKEDKLESLLFGGMTPIFKSFYEIPANRNTFTQRQLTPSGFGRGMLEQYQRGERPAHTVYTARTSEWAKEMSYLLEVDLDALSITPIMLDYIHATYLGNIGKKLDFQSVPGSFIRSEGNYPVYKDWGKTK